MEVDEVRLDTGPLFVALEVGGYEICSPFEMKVIGVMSSLQAL